MTAPWRLFCRRGLCTSLSMSGLQDKQRTLVNTVGVPGDAGSSPCKSRGGMPKYDPVGTLRQGCLHPSPHHEYGAWHTVLRDLSRTSSLSCVYSNHNVHMYTLNKVSSLLPLVLITSYCVGTSTYWWTRNHKTQPTTSPQRGDNNNNNNNNTSPHTEGVFHKEKANSISDFLEI
jgi:hypothetical protein